MKYRNITLRGALAAFLIGLTACADLDLNPLTEPSSGTWNSSLDEVRISLNDLYRSYPYSIETNWFTDRRTDDFAQRTTMYDIPAGTLASTTSWISTSWSYTYKAISRCNRVIESVDRLGINSDEAIRLRAEAHFFRAYFYARLITLWGDVPYYTGAITIDEARQMGRTPKNDIKKAVYADYDYASENLPESNVVSGIWRVNKGAALALKARIALTMEDWEIARDAAKECIDMHVYSLAPDYGELFRDKSMDNGEFIFAIANSADLGQSSAAGSFMLRTAGGTAAAQPALLRHWGQVVRLLGTDSAPSDLRHLRQLPHGANRLRHRPHRPPIQCHPWLPGTSPVHGRNSPSIQPHEDARE